MFLFPGFRGHLGLAELPWTQIFSFPKQTSEWAMLISSNNRDITTWNERNYKQDLVTILNLEEAQACRVFMCFLLFFLGGGGGGGDEEKHLEDVFASRPV